MTPAQFRTLALAEPGSVEGSHQGHPDFRINGRVFATLGYPDADWAMIKLPPEDQRFLVASLAGVFEPAAGAWGKAGSTLVRLRVAPLETVRDALGLAGAHAAGQRAPRKRSS